MSDPLNFHVNKNIMTDRWHSNLIESYTFERESLVVENHNFIDLRMI